MGCSLNNSSAVKYASNHIKEELISSWEGANQSDCSINPLTEQIQGTDTPTPIMGCSLNNSSAVKYASNHIKEELISSWEGANQSDCSINPLTEKIEVADMPTPIMGYGLNNSSLANYISVVIKEEAASWEGGNQSDCSINPLTEQIQGTDTPTPIMGCSLNISEGIKEEPASCKEENQSGYNIITVSEPVQGTDIPTTIMGCSLNNSLSANYIENGIKDEATSWVGRNQSDCSINPLTEQIQGTDTPTPIMGCSLNNSPIKMTCNKYNENAARSPHKSHSAKNPSSHNERSFDTHQAIQTGEKRFPCSECGKWFASQKYLSFHQRIHTEEKPYSCRECGKCLSTQASLDRHYRTHTRDKDSFCSVCKKYYSNPSFLKIHQERAHAKEKPFSCSECGKRFINETELTVHRRRTHTGEKPFLCPDCGKSYSSTTNLTIHYRTHTGEKPYPCPDCGKRFATSSSVTTHRQRIHTDDKPISCPECGKRFLKISELTAHQRMHTGEKPFSCTECDKSFARKGSLKTHFLEIHAD
eukprot:XP_017944998.1 PREDICTED: oocyte zinc finger protein XlCOF7.1-like [Xenopus tropicalis]